METFAEVNNKIYPGTLTPVDRLMVNKHMEIIADLQAHIMKEYKTS